MKVFNYAIMALAVLTMGLTSCTNDDEGTPNEGENARINISVSSPENTKASVTSPTSLPTAAVNNYTVFVVDGHQLISKYSSSSSALSGDNAIKATTNASEIYVVANAGDLTSTITTLSGLTSYLADLNGTGSQTGTDGPWATGKATIASSDFTLTDGKYTAAKTVTITFIAARITVKVVNNMKNYTETGAVVLDSLAVLNARGQSLLFGETLIPTTYSKNKQFYTGIAKPTATASAYWPKADSVTVAADLLSDALPKPATNTNLNSKTYYYYVFQNDATTAAALPTIVTLVGKFGQETLYWPVHLAPYEQWTTDSGTSTNTNMTTSIVRGKSYDITITLTGDAQKGGGGISDPSKALFNADVAVTVQLTGWSAITLNKEF